MSKGNILKLNCFHFIVAIIVFGVVTNMIGHKSINGTFTDDTQDYLIGLTNETFSDSISSGECFVLFYTEDSELCAEMHHNLNQLAKTKQENVKFLKLNVSKYPESVYEYNISGVPNIFIFKEGKEHKRVMGVVPTHNLEKIYSKLF